MLDEAEEIFGPSIVLYYERQCHAEALGRRDLAATAARQAALKTARTGWEHYALGRSLVRSGKLAEASAEFQAALQLQPDSFWAHFYRGTCAYRLKQYLDAVVAFSVCIGHAPDNAICYYNRALALTALEQPDSAINDYEQALRLDSTLAPGVLNRGLLHYRANRLAAARADLQRALQLGANPATVYYNLALVCPAENDRVQALQNLREALVRDPEHRDARELQDKVSRQP